MVRPALGQPGGELGPGQRGLAEQGGRRVGQLGQVDPAPLSEVPPEVPGQVALHQGLVQGAEAEVVRGVHQVDGVTHQVGAYHGPFGQKIPQFLMTEAGQPRPQPDVRGQRGLGLQPGQVPDRLPGGQPGAVQQQLARQRGAVQRAQAQPAGTHPRAAAVGWSAG